MALNKDCFRRCVRKRTGWLTWILTGGAAAVAVAIALISGGWGILAIALLVAAIFGAVYLIALIICFINCNN